MVAPSSTSHGFPLDITNIGVSVIVGEKSTSINPNMVIVRRVPPIAPSLIKYVLSCSRDTRDSRESGLGHSRQMEERSYNAWEHRAHIEQGVIGFNGDNGCCASFCTEQEGHKKRRDVMLT